MLDKIKKIKSFFYLGVIFLSCYLLAAGIDLYDFQADGDDIVIFDKRLSKTYRLKNQRAYSGLIIKLPIPEDWEEDEKTETEENKEKEKLEKAQAELEEKRKEELKKDLGDSADNSMIHLLIEKSKESYKKGDLSLTLKYLQQAQEIEPNSALIYKMMGSVYLELENKEEGLRLYKESLKFNPDQDDLKIEIKRLESE